MKRVIICLILVFAASVTQQKGFVPTAVAAEAVEPWKAEFDSLCGQTDSAAEMSVAELKKALEKCDSLKPKIEALEATPRKVYLKRLQMCRNLFAYLLEGKNKQ
jgi:hypothetical protein